MKLTFSGLLLPLALASCSVFNPLRDQEYRLDPTRVELQATVPADAPLTISVETFVGGCRGFDRFRATRTASQLQLEMMGKERVGSGVVCNTGVVKQTHVYTDPGTPARTSPFEIIVNGKSYGTVSVQ